MGERMRGSKIGQLAGIISPTTIRLMGGLLPLYLPVD